MSAWKPFGRYKVGFQDVEWLHESSRNGGEDPSKHFVGRIFYPCADQATKGWLPLFKGVSWLPDYSYAKGMAKFLFFRTKGLLSATLQQAVQNIVAVVGKAQLMDLHADVTIEGVPDTKHPVVLFSHGIGGNRMLYSIICSELASQGYVVLAVEHADGTAGACKLAGQQGWKFYQGLGGEEAQVKKTKHRVQEMKTGLKILRSLNKGEPLEGLVLSHGADPSVVWREKLDFKCLAAIGHSYGGATITALIAEDPVFRCGIALDPWWNAVPPDCAALAHWQTRTPLLVMGSHDWNIPNSSGGLACGGERQEAILNAAKSRRKEREVSGAGAMLLVISGTSHHSFADPLALFSQHLGWLLDKLGLASRLDPVLGIHLITTATLNFLSTHLPLLQAQRDMQSWEPGKDHGALDRIQEAASRGSKGMLQRLWPRGQHVINAVSDWTLNRLLEQNPGKKGHSNGVDMQQGTDDNQDPNDLIAGIDVLETVMPSSNPASGPRPHAPSQCTTLSRDSAEGPAHHKSTAEQAAEDAVLASIGRSYHDVIKDEEIHDYRALLGELNIFKCEVHS